jgi:Tfp pilus assembly protein PilE
MLDSMMWDVDVPTLMDNIRSYTMYNSITLTPQQQQKLLDVMTIAVNKRLYDDRESLEALVDDPVLLNILVQMSPVLESYSNYIQDLKRHIVKSAVADLSAVLEHQINNTQSSLYQSLNNAVVTSFPTLKSARDEIYTNPSDVSKLQKFEQTKTRILKDCVTTTCTTLIPILQNHFTPDSLRDYSKGRVTSPTLLRGGDRMVNDIVRTMYSPSSIKTYSASIDNSSLRDVSSSMLKSYSQAQSVIFDIFRLPSGVLSSVSGAIGSISTIIGTAAAFSTLPLAVVRNVSSLISNTFSTVSAAERTIMNMMNLPTTVLNNVQSTINNVQGLVTQISGLGTNLLSNFEKLNDIVSPIQRTIPDFDLLCSEFSIHPSDSNLSSILQSFADCPSCFLGGDPPTDTGVQNLLNKFAESRKTGSYTDTEYAYNAELLG